MYTDNNKQRKGKALILSTSIVALSLGGCAVNEKDPETKPDPVVSEEKQEII